MREIDPSLVQLSPESVDALAVRLARVLERGPVRRVLLRRDEAAAALGMSLDHFERNVQPSLKLVRSGRLILVPPREIERWAERNARILGRARAP